MTTTTDETSLDKTPTDKFSVQTKKSTKPSKRLVAMLAAGLLVVVGGITLTSVSVANAAADETARLCAVALKDSATATTSRTAALAKADAALEAVKSVALPTNAWISTDYAARPGVTAIEAVAAIEAVPAVAPTDNASGVAGSAAVAAVAAVQGRTSGAEMITRMTAARGALAKVSAPVKCEERETAARITALTAKSASATKTLGTSATAMVGDFAVFQDDETARITAEIEGARVAAEAEAARVAAEAAAAEAAAAEAAAAEAARVAAAQRTAARPSTGGVRTGTGTGTTRPPSGGVSGGGSSGTPSGGGGPVGGGFGAPINTGPCRTSNGMGGTMPCP